MTLRYKTLELQLGHGVAVVWLNRPELRNAFDGTLIAELTAALRALDADEAVRAVVLAGQGKAFCAGADLAWMKRMAAAGVKENRDDALALANLLHTLYTMNKPTVARVHGAAYAGGLGLIACCDIAVAALDAEFCVAEVKLGLAPATISPYLVRAIGERQARRFFLSAEVFTAADAYRLGLVHEIVPAPELDGAVNQMLGYLVKGGPRAQAASKDLIRTVAGTPITRDLLAETAVRIADLRASDEGRAGLQAFFDKRPAPWTEAFAGKPRKAAKRAAKRKNAKT